jgi:hypothetical protein
MASVAAVLVFLAVLAVLAFTSWRWGADSRVGRDWEWRAADSSPTGEARSGPGAGPSGGHRRVRGFLADQAERRERLVLMNRPWEENFLHWTGDPSNPRLHGRVPPPRDRRRRSVTRGGWCPGLASESRPDTDADLCRRSS